MRYTMGSRTTIKWYTVDKMEMKPSQDRLEALRGVVHESDLETATLPERSRQGPPERIRNKSRMMAELKLSEHHLQRAEDA